MNRREAGVVLASVMVIVLVATAGGALGAGLTPTSKKIVAGAIGPPTFFVNSALTGNGGGTAGRVQANDTLVIVFAGQALQSTLCSSWSNASSAQSLAGFTFTLNDNTGTGSTDTLTVTGTPVACASGFHFGTFDLKLGTYVSGGAATFTNSSIALSQTAASTTVTLTFGTAGGTGVLATAASTSAAVYTPDATVTDTAATAVGLNFATTTTTKQF